MDTKPRPLIIRPGEGRRLRGPVGGPARVLVDGGSTGGAFTAIENLIPAHQGPPVHRHTAEDEMYWVLEGGVRFRLCDQELLAPTGSFVYIPRGTPHAFRNDDEVPCRLLVMFSPSGMETLFDDLGALPDEPLDPARYRQIAARARMELLGPPLGAPGAG